MVSGNEFLLRPVHAGMVPYQAINDPSLSLWDFAEMNEYLDVLEENERRVRDYYEEKDRGAC